MNDQPFASPTPPNEAWWERELHRNEKLMDRYMKVFEDEGEGAFDKYDTPDKLYNKVHYGIEPGEPLPPAALARESERDPVFEDWKEEVLNAAAEAAEEAQDELDAQESEDEDLEDEDDDQDLDEDEDYDEEEEDSEPILETAGGEEEPDPLDPRAEADETEYQTLARQARDFAIKILRLSARPEIEEVLMRSAGKIGANLAGGHGLGYDEDTLCGNIVKCRWALADCEFCREILEHMARRTGDPMLADLVTECEALSTVLRERVAALRARVWW